MSADLDLCDVTMFLVKSIGLTCPPPPPHGALRLELTCLKYVSPSALRPVCSPKSLLFKFICDCDGDIFTCPAAADPRVERFGPEGTPSSERRRRLTSRESQPSFVFIHMNRYRTVKASLLFIIILSKDVIT